MWINNLRISFRKLGTHKSQSAILIGGLVVGMASCIMLLQYVSYELSFDNFHTKIDRIYRLVNERFQEGQSVQKGTITYPTIGRAMMEEFPEIKNVTRMTIAPNVILTMNDVVESAGQGLWADEHFFEMFDFEILSQDGLRVLDETNEIMLSRHLAEQFFPAIQGQFDHLIGKTLKVDRFSEDFKIVGIFEDVPANSTLQFHVLLSYASCIRYWGEGADNSWQWSDFYHYLELEPKADAEALVGKFDAFSQRRFRGAEVSGNNEVFSLQALSKAHLYSADLEYEIGQTVNGRAVWSLLLVAFFLLVIAWINYVNLSSVRAIERSKEVGVRKVVGATRDQLVRQFFSEALVVNVISLIFALGIVQFITPWFAAKFGLDASVLGFFNGHDVNLYLVSALVALILIGVLVSGAYPAWILSSPQISNVLKGVFKRNLKGVVLRKVLVVMQFSLSIALIAATWLVGEQLSFMSKRDLGFEADQLIRINPPEMSNFDSSFIDRMNIFKTELANIPGIESAATSNRVPGDQMGRIFKIRKVGDGQSNKSYTSNFLNTDFEYAKTYGLKPLAGRFFRREDHSLDFNQLNNIVVTEATIKMLGGQKSEEAIGQQLNFYGKDWNIIGVLPDFHQRSLHHAIEPIVFLPSYSPNNLLTLRVDRQNIDQTIASVQIAYRKFFPGNTFDYRFLDEHFQRLYEADLRFSSILSFFTLLTILIACLGLFGLASYTTYLRTKEIGIRKILGASTGGIIRLLSKDFLKLILIALLIGGPLAWLFMNKWLENFAYRIEIHWWMFFLAGMAAVLVAFLTVSIQGLRAALANPADSLRSE